MLATLPAAWFLLLPDAFVSFARSVAAVTLFVSNVLFWREEGYFAATAETKPLLHTWSLAVEEQFYLAFPWLLYLTRKWQRRRVALLLLVIGAGSFLLCELALIRWQTANFFLAPTRAWELMAGALCAFASLRRDTAPAKGAAALGLALIVGGIVWLNSAVPFPSHYALLPVGGTALVILFCDARYGIGRLLGLRPVVGIGLVSYSFYLWHQPLFAFARLASPTHPSETTLLLLGLSALVLAVVSWALVERPFRSGKGPRFARRSIVLGVAVTTLFVAFWVYAEASKGLRGRLTPTSDTATLAFVRSRIEQAPVPAGCHREADDAMPPCLAYGRPDARRRIAVFGDSHGGALMPALEVLGRTPDTAIFYGWRGGCPPLLGVYVLAGKRPKRRMPQAGRGGVRRGRQGAR